MTIIHLISNKVWGGGEKYALDLILRQRAEGHETLAITKGIADVDTHLIEAGITTINLPLRGFFDLKSAYGIAKLLRSHDKTESVVIHAHNFNDAFVAMHSRRLAWRRSPRIVVTRHLVKKAKTWLPYNILYRNIDALIFVSELARDTFLKSNPRTGNCDIRVIHNAVDVPHNIVPTDLRSFYGLGSDTIIAMFHGRLTKEKGLDTLVEALAKCSNKKIHLLITGTGDERYVERIEKRVKKLKLSERITMTGFQKDVKPLIAGCDFGVIPTIAPESFGLACAEYMAQGKAIISTDNGAQKEFISNGENGLLVPPSDDLALAAAMQLLAGESELRDKLGKAARQTVISTLNYDIFYNNTMDTYHN
ncbi:MAG: glycosyltransferase family 4 protein [Paludibacteraceae bacterium]|nr:glycosyltransferase family 4 protein [Paludibacteraceae bacterium]